MFQQKRKVLTRIRGVHKEIQIGIKNMYHSKQVLACFSYYPCIKPRVLRVSARTCIYQWPRVWKAISPS